MRTPTAADAVFFAFFGYVFLALLAALGGESALSAGGPNAVQRLVDAQQEAAMRFNAVLAGAVPAGPDLGRRAEPPREEGPREAVTLVRQIAVSGEPVASRTEPTAFLR